MPALAVGHAVRYKGFLYFSLVPTLYYGRTVAWFSYQAK